MNPNIRINIILSMDPNATPTLVQDNDIPVTLLERFIEIVNETSVARTPQEVELVKMMVFIVNYCDKETSSEDFNTDVKNQQLEKKLTPIFTSDFVSTEGLKLQDLVRQNNGICVIKSDPKNDARDVDENEMYAVFPTPMDAFTFTKMEHVMEKFGEILLLLRK